VRTQPESQLARKHVDIEVALHKTTQTTLRRSVRHTHTQALNQSSHIASHSRTTAVIKRESTRTAT
jgi:hypothetical protein